jgi:hypothetical protein
VLVEHEVVRLDVPMQYLLLFVAGEESGDQLPRPFPDVSTSNRLLALTGDVLLHGLAGDVLHDEVEELLGGSNLVVYHSVELDDVGMADLGEHFYLVNLSASHRFQFVFL